MGMIAAFLMGIVCLLIVVIVWMGFKYLEQGEQLNQLQDDLSACRKASRGSWL